ncbi:MAG: DNA alkylation repair protein [Roseibium sp.]|uniref:DNA alkylation repair protein n=1 Tax=Roseibium sp. TaxID=1936156 RepID=UPI00260BB6A6|nr:DNA alkylation repair protein [Roseibium sp.]MCV0428361.1 DNA alkylation repair protein [Roseibium sp.]
MENLRRNVEIEALHGTITMKLSSLGESTPYAADANEPDPRYLGYGARAPEMRRVISGFKTDFSMLGTEQKVELAERLIGSGYGEQKSVALALLEQVPEYFSPERFDLLEKLIRGLHGWSKIDSFTKFFLKQILDAHEDKFIELPGRVDELVSGAACVAFES